MLNQPASGLIGNRYVRQLMNPIVHHDEKYGIARAIDAHHSIKKHLNYETRKSGVKN